MLIEKNKNLVWIKLTSGEEVMGMCQNFSGTMLELTAPVLVRSDLTLRDFTASGNFNETIKFNKNTILASGYPSTQATEKYKTWMADYK